MPTTNTLTDARCRAAKSDGKATKLFDGGGLYLYLATTGSKTWRLAYRVAGKPQTLSIGPYPAVGLAEARAKREEAKARLRSGVDAKPKAVRAAMTLETACSTYWAGRKDVSETYLANATRAIEMHALPQLGQRPIGQITREELLATLMHLDAAGKHEYVRKVRMWLAQVWDWAIEQSEATTNPARLIQPERAFGKSKVEHFAALELTDMPAFLERLSMEKELQSVLACKMLALTWVRTGELRMMLWNEIDGDLWRIPEGKMKRRKDHLVPLSRQALALLAKLKARCRGSDYVFPNDLRDDRPMSENAVLYLMARMGYKGQMTGHGFRTVGSTWANEHGYNADAIERQLAHTPEDKVRASYNRAEHIVARRKMLQDWADWLMPD
ncbi:MAG: integrase arm-type DNA-binding domain-containing protein [Hydrogenophaga sp.]|uniref:tyrosine-type recombinase/integrase n=1 Tax=Hydrogenophaga sp. TaxID=1904254 RepID=UPI00273169FE|nr:integrase arm-type DNA-binding domain-containing protein [Hydrogenophaga sp.]MDP2015505.1 integrase arm-type DNA-binding domain-containing protein [Hydrogenophaga sp.]MDP3252992.1 integrase arm-type DNA-binding domain-containing protein [Hydrogenophaga sp.]